MSKIFKFYLWSLFTLILSIYLGLHLGVVSHLDFHSIIQLRLPRVVLAMATGIALCVSGATLQALFTNPLCEPYTLGISSGSALGAVLGSFLGLETSFFGLTGGAFLGGLFFAVILLLISIKSHINLTPLLLSGVMLGFLGSSGVALCMALGDPQGIQGALFWLMGDLSRARISGALISLCISIVLVFFLWIKSPCLDAFLMGEETASTLGISVGDSRRWFILLSSILVGLAVAGSGMIGFVGLMIPHFVRRKVGALHFHLIPLCSLWGASALILADLLARVIIKPYELPVGVVTSLIGAPFFIIMVLKNNNNGTRTE